MRNQEFNQDEVIRIAMCIFWQKGYTATSIQHLVDGIGLKSSHSLAHFKVES